MVVTIALWLTLAPAIGAIARVRTKNREPRTRRSPTTGPGPSLSCPQTASSGGHAGSRSMGQAMQRGSAEPCQWDQEAALGCVLGVEGTAPAVRSPDPVRI
jgi:hypothetical protein